MEAHIQKQIVDYLREHGAYVVKVSIASRSGVPDLLVCYRGMFLGLEVKAERGRQTPLQEYNLASISEAGGYSAVVHSVDEVCCVLNVIRKSMIHQQQRKGAIN